MDRINLLKLTRINCLGKSTWHWNDIWPRQLGIWPLINLIRVLVYFCLSLSLTDVCPITVSMAGSARKHGTASSALVRRRGTVGPPATTVSAHSCHHDLYLSRPQVLSYLGSAPTWFWRTQILLLLPQNSTVVIEIYCLMPNDTKEGPTCPMIRKHSWDWNADLGFASVCLSHVWIDGLGNCVSVMSLTGFSFISSSERQTEYNLDI